MQTVTVFGVPIHNISYAEARQRVFEVLDRGSYQELVVTPNPEILLHAAANTDYAMVLGKATLALPDGFGLKLFTPLQHRVAGSDIAKDIVKHAGKSGLRILCVVRKDGLSSQKAVEEAVKRMAPGAVVEVAAIGLNDDVQQYLPGWKSLQPHVLLVGLGFPQQEELIIQYGPMLPSVRVAMGIGGTFDFWTGVQKRAPWGMRVVGLEWLWRLIRQPSRIRRIFRAVLVFPINLLFRR